MATQAEVKTFVALLKHFGIFEPEDKYKIVCPFHDDKNASLQINVSNAFFFCYAGCGAQGSSLELYKNFYKVKHPDNPFVSDLKASVAVRKITGMKLPTPSMNALEGLQSAKASGIREARQYYYSLVDPNWFRPSEVQSIREETVNCRNYMNGRGFRNNTLKKFQAKPSLNQNYPIVFPLLENGLFRGYVMRTFDKEIEQQRKYMYNRGFHRQKVLCGNYKNQKCVVCVEGYFDLVKANQLGINNTVAFLGWKASKIHLQKLKKAGVKTIICALDNDEAGRKGYHYLKSIAKDYSFAVYRLHYPKGIKDMGDIRKDTREEKIVKNQISQLTK